MKNKIVMRLNRSCWNSLLIDTYYKNLLKITFILLSTGFCITIKRR